LDVLELLGNAPGGLPAWEIVQAIGADKATIHRLVKTMIHKGFVKKEFNPQRYLLCGILEGLRVRQAAWNRCFLTPAVKYVIGLARNANCHAWAAQYVGSEAVGRFRCNVDDPNQTRIVYGWRASPYGSALAFQAYMDPAQLSDYQARHSLTESDRLYWKSFCLIRQMLPLVRSEGYVAFAKDGGFRASAAVFDGDACLCGILSIVKDMRESAPPSLKDSVKMLRDAAAALSNEISESIHWDLTDPPRKPVGQERGNRPVTSSGRPVEGQVPRRRS
jgi:DNA-binding IclR family transcriptional regulator